MKIFMKIKCNRSALDIVIIIVITIISFFIFSYFDMLEKIVRFSAQHEEYEIDEFISTSIMLTFCLTWFSIRRSIELKNKNEILKNKNIELEKTITENKELKSILPICSYCKKIRDDSGFWEQVDVYLHKHSDSLISHGICPECMEKNHPEAYAEYKLNKKKSSSSAN